MDRKGQTWHFKSTVLSVFRSERPTLTRTYWLHSVLYLEHAMPEYVGTLHKLEEGVDQPFERYAGLRRLT